MQLRILSFKGGVTEWRRIFFVSLKRATFVQSHKSSQKDSLKNFSVILSDCPFTKEYEELLHPILPDSFGISMGSNSRKSDKWKIFGRHLFPSFWNSKLSRIFEAAIKLCAIFLLTFLHFQKFWIYYII